MSKFLNISLVVIGLMAIGSNIDQTQVIAQDKKTDKSKQEIEKIVRDYILKNPEILIESIQRLQERDKLAKIKPVLETYKTYLYSETNATETGNPKGDVTVIEFFDYRCGYCKRHYPEIKKLLAADKNIRVVYKHYPILDYNDKSKKSRTAAFGAMAAQKQGKFIEYHSKMMSTSAPVSEDLVMRVAQMIGLDMVQFTKDLNSSVFEKQIMNALVVGADLELTGTPSYIIGTNVISGAIGYDNIKGVIARVRKQQKDS